MKGDRTVLNSNQQSIDVKNINDFKYDIYKNDKEEDLFPADLAQRQ